MNASQEQDLKDIAERAKAKLPKRKPCRICTSIKGEPTPHDPSRLHTDTVATDGKKKVGA